MHHGCAVATSITNGVVYFACCFHKGSHSSSFSSSTFLPPSIYELHQLFGYSVVLGAVLALLQPEHPKEIRIRDREAVLWLA